MALFLSGQGKGKWPSVGWSATAPRASLSLHCWTAVRTPQSVRPPTSVSLHSYREWEEVSGGFSLNVEWPACHTAARQETFVKKRDCNQRPVPRRPCEGLLACGAGVELQECFLTSLWRGIKCVMREIGAVTWFTVTQRHRPLARWGISESNPPVQCQACVQVSRKKVRRFKILLRVGPWRRKAPPPRISRQSRPSCN